MNVLVTGTSSGIGLETAVFLAERGMRVFAAMRDVQHRQRLDEAAARRNARVEVIQLDVRDPRSIDGAVAALIARAGRIDALVNNAGIQLRGYFEDTSDRELRDIFETNVFGTIAVTRAVLPHMRHAGRGRILMMTSVGGRIAAPGLSGYCAAKFAIEGFSEALALELAPLGIQVCLVEPGMVRTDIWSRNRNVARGALAGDSPYASWFRESERLADTFVQTSPTTVRDVAQVVHTALTKRRPRLRYVIGRRARLTLALRRHLPGELFERFYFGYLLKRLSRAAR